MLLAFSYPGTNSNQHKKLNNIANGLYACLKEIKKGGNTMKDRQTMIDEITEMLKTAGYRDLRIAWVFVRELTKNKESQEGGKQ